MKRHFAIRYFKICDIFCQLSERTAFSCLFNDLILSVPKGVEGMLRWTSPWGSQASQDRCWNICWFCWRGFDFGQFQTFNANQRIYSEAMAFRLVQHCQYFTTTPWIVTCVCGFWRDQLASVFVASGLGQETPTDTVSTRMASTEEVPNSSFSDSDFNESLSFFSYFWRIFQHFCQS